MYHTLLVDHKTIPGIGRHIVDKMSSIYNEYKLYHKELVENLVVSICDKNITAQRVTG